MGARLFGVAVLLGSALILSALLVRFAWRHGPYAATAPHATLAPPVLPVDTVTVERWLKAQVCGGRLSFDSAARWMQHDVPGAFRAWQGQKARAEAWQPPRR